MSEAAAEEKSSGLIGLVLVGLLQDRLRGGSESKALTAPEELGETGESQRVGTISVAAARDGPTWSRIGKGSAVPTWAWLSKRLPKLSDLLPGLEKEAGSEESVARVEAHLIRYLGERYEGLRDDLTLKRIVNMLAELNGWSGACELRRTAPIEDAFVTVAQTCIRKRRIARIVRILRCFCRNELVRHVSYPSERVSREIVAVPVGAPMHGRTRVVIHEGLRGDQSWWAKHDGWTRLHIDGRDHLARPEDLARPILENFRGLLDRMFPRTVTPSQIDGVQPTHEQRLRSALLRALGSMALSNKCRSGHVKEMATAIAEEVSGSGPVATRDQQCRLIETLLKFAIRWDPLVEIKHQLQVSRDWLGSEVGRRGGLDALNRQVMALHDVLILVFDEAAGVAARDKLVSEWIVAVLGEYENLPDEIDGVYRRIMTKALNIEGPPTDGLLSACQSDAGAGFVSEEEREGRWAHDWRNGREIWRMLEIRDRRRYEQERLRKRRSGYGEQHPLEPESKRGFGQELMASQLRELYTIVGAELFGYKTGDVVPPYRRVGSVTASGLVRARLQAIANSSARHGDILIVNVEGLWAPFQISALVRGLVTLLTQRIDAMQPWIEDIPKANSRKSRPEP